MPRILDYVLRDMTDRGGGFYSAQDADSVRPDRPDEHGEGAYYVWSADELTQRLGARDESLFDFVYGVEVKGNVQSDPHDEFRGLNILYRAHSSEDAAKRFDLAAGEVDRRLQAAGAKLLAARGQRPPPARDDKVLTAWNGLMISALARAALAFDEPRYAQAAEKAAGFLRDTLWDEAHGTLQRRWRAGDAAISGQLDDHAFLIQGLLDLYEADYDVRWLQWAERLTDRQIALFWDVAAGGFFETAGQDASLLLRGKGTDDGAEPAANSVAALNLLRLAEFTDREDLRAHADQLFTAFGAHLRQVPSTLPQMLAAVDYELAPKRQVVIAGDPTQAATRALIDVLRPRFLPNKILLLADGGAGQVWLKKRLDFLSAVKPVGGVATAYVCYDRVCQLPTTQSQEMARQLDQGHVPGPGSLLGSTHQKGTHKKC